MTVAVNESILVSILNLLGIESSVTAFDDEVTMHINSVFSELCQLGVGPEQAYSITDRDDLWTDFVTDVDLNMVKSYMWLEVRLMFDPPTASLLMALERKRDEYEWRLNVAADRPIDRSESQNGSDE